MKTSRVIVFVLVMLCALFPAPAQAAYYNDPCASLARQVQYVFRRVTQAETRVQRAHDNLLRVQNRFELRLSALDGNVGQAYANMQAASSVSGGYAAGCAINIFFGRGYGCIGGSIRSGINRNARARAAYRSAVARRNSYVVYAQGAIRRQAGRIQYEESRYNSAVDSLNTARNDFAQCRASNPCPAESPSRCAVGE